MVLDVFFPGAKIESPWVIGKITIEAHIVPKLESKLLIGIDVSAPEGITLDFTRKTATIVPGLSASETATAAGRDHSHGGWLPVYHSSGRSFILLPVDDPERSPEPYGRSLAPWTRDHQGLNNGLL